MKPLWAVAGVALLGISGAVGALLVASSGGEEEVVQQVETATPTRGAVKDPRTTPTETPSAAMETPTSCDPNRSPAPGNIVFRWGDITVQLPADGRIRAVGSVGGQDSGPTLELFVDVTGAGNTYVDATTGAILPDSYIDPTTGASVPRERWTHTEVEAVLATISLCQFNPAAAP